MNDMVMIGAWLGKTKEPCFEMRYTKWFTFQNGFIGFTAARFQGHCRPVYYGKQAEEEGQFQQDSQDADQIESNIDNIDH